MKNISFEELCAKISNIYNNKIEVELDELEDIFVQFIKQLFMRVFKVDREPIVEIIDCNQNAGCYNGYATFSINRKVLKKFQDGKALDLFEVICHELNHFSQKRNYKNINIKNSFIEKDSYLKDLIEGYYNSNYYLLMEEIDAFLSQSKDAMEILNILKMVPSVEEIEILKQRKNEHEKNIFITDRIVGNEVKNIEEVFETFQENSVKMDDFDKSSFLEFHPCVNIEYKNIEGKFVKRTYKEIECLYENWQTGIFKLHGLPTEINLYFRYVIEKLKSVEKDTYKKL